MHPNGTQRPQNTLRWLEHRDVERHWHVRVDTPGDFERLARFAAGRAIGLVLSGGGARGFAHVGIIQTLQEAGIPVDMIAGVSMGALISSGFAYSDDFAAKVRHIKAQLRGVMNDFTIPLISLARERRFDQRLKVLFGETKIEELWLPYFCVSSNLTQANIVVHRTGPLWQAVRASGNLPGIVPPVIQNGDLLYDGCLLNNLPIDVMRREIGTGLVIAVNVVPPVDLQVEVSNIESPSGWQILWSRLNPFAKRINLPSIVSVIRRAGELGSVFGRQKLIDEQIADLYLRPPVEQFEILDFSTVNETAKRGYEFGKERLCQWWDTIQRSAVIDKKGPS